MRQIVDRNLNDKKGASLYTKLLVATFVVLAFILVIALRHVAVTASFDGQRLAAAERILTLDRLHQVVLQAESTQRAFLLTGQGRYLEEYEIHRAESWRLLADFESTRFSPHTSATQVARMLILVGQRLEALESVRRLHDDEGSEAAVAKVQAGGGTAIMESYLLLDAKVGSAEERFMQELRTETALRNSYTLYILIGGFVLIIVLTGLTLLVSHRDLRREKGDRSLLADEKDRISLLNELNNSLLSCATHEEANGVIARSMQVFFPTTSGDVYLHRPSRDQLERQVTWNGSGSAGTEMLLPSECWGLRRGQTHHNKSTSGLQCQHVPSDGAGESVCIPMMALGETVGMMTLHNEAGITANQISLAETIAAQVASAMANLSLRSALQLQSIKDPLTGLFNRRYLEETMRRELVRAHRSSAPVTVVMADVDHFKNFNDTHGHQAGDQVLQRVAAEIEQRVRGDDVACRYGGEEFTLVLPGANLEQGSARAEEIRKAVGSMQIRVGDQSVAVVTVSFGVASYPQHGSDATSVLAQADQALYQAKKAGRNRVVNAE